MGNIGVAAAIVAITIAESVKVRGPWPRAPITLTKELQVCRPRFVESATVFGLAEPFARLRIFSRNRSTQEPARSGGGCGPARRERALRLRIWGWPKEKVALRHICNDFHRLGRTLLLRVRDAPRVSR